VQGHREVALGVDDVRVGVERRQRLLQLACGRDNALGVGQAEPLVERDSGVLPDVETLRAVEPGHALDDDLLRGGAGGQGEGRCERADGERYAHIPVVGADG
jgi:hypothetical protein